MIKTMVYCFTVFDIKQGENVMAKRMATLEAIKSANGVPLMDTAKEVDIYAETGSCYLWSPEIRQNV